MSGGRSAVGRTARLGACSLLAWGGKRVLARCRPARHRDSTSPGRQYSSSDAVHRTDYIPFGAVRSGPSSLRSGRSSSGGRHRTGRHPQEETVMRSETPDRPDILLIISDDHGYADRSARGSRDARTPHLDRLAREGVVFDQGYVTAPICSPSRAGLIAGAHQPRWGAQWFDTSAFPPPQQTAMPEVLQQAGYRTGYFGKVHYGPEGPGDRACPENHGFDESLYGLAGLSMGRLHYLHHSRAAADEYGEAASAHGVDPLRENGREVECERHLTVEFTDRALEFMGEGDEGQDPYFCMVAYNAVHNFAWQLPQDELDARALPRHDDFDPASADYLDWYDGAISPHLEHGREYYLAQLEIMDRETGRLLDHLEATGRRESTLVVYLTDNGGSTCNYGDNAPLDGTKYSLFEGGVQVPMILSRPGTVPAGERSEALVSSLDLLPTFAAAAGAEVPPSDPIDGMDLRPVWEGRSPPREA